MESRMLALIRSANDSVKEVELYQSRGHGFLLKGPMKKGGLLEESKLFFNVRKLRAAFSYASNLSLLFLFLFRSLESQTVVDSKVHACRQT
jgi:hypothetical protein